MTNNFAPAAVLSDLNGVLGNHPIDPFNPKNTGAPGHLLDYLLGIEPNNNQCADLAIKLVELKWHGGAKTPVTLIHFDPLERPVCASKGKPGKRGAIKELIDTHGYIRKGRPRAFRHMLSGNKLTSRGFRVVIEDDLVVVRHHNTFICSWRLDDIITRLAAKLNHVAFYSGKRQGQRVNFESFTAFWGFRPSAVRELIASGVMLLDFDARRHAGVTDAIRNHGVKFRIAKPDLHRLFQHQRSA